MAATGPGLNFPINVVGRIIRCDMVSHVAAINQVGMFSSWYRVDSVGGAGTTLGAIATTVNGMFATFVKNAMAPNATFRGVVARMVAPAPPSPPSWENASAGPGTVVGDLCPTQVTGVISLHTAFAGRAYRGRRYIPFPSEADNQATSIPSAAYLTVLDSIRTQLLTSFTVGAADNARLVPIIYHRATSTHNDLVGGLTRTGWGTQRRRSYFGRQNPLPF